ncbi:class F sortase [Pseudonocardia terrae]|uniref:class F sortase n=1 Tax=Pseudonocardia terrae TaxID=2905831 RepID=UPI0027E16FED|nr:class F sortase [Pseudonocardia terrae]
MAALILVLVSGCAGTTDAGGNSPAASVQTSVVASAESGQPTMAASHPTRLRVPAIDVDARGVIDLGLQADRTMEVPADGTKVGWYTESPTPGERGPAVLAAHVDWNHQKGAFYDLHSLKPGDEIMVDRADGSTARFQVRQVAQYSKDAFPTQKVYGDVAGAELRLITCGGELDRAARSYRDNIVVYAGLVSST